MVAASKNAEARDEYGCEGSVCQHPTGVEVTNQARDMATGSTIAFGIGGALLTTGIGLYLLAPNEQGVDNLAIVPRVGGASMVWGGEF